MSMAFSQHTIEEGLNEESKEQVLMDSSPLLKRGPVKPLQMKSQKAGELVTLDPALLKLAPLFARFCQDRVPVYDTKYWGMQQRNMAAELCGPLSSLSFDDVHLNEALEAIGGELKPEGEELVNSNVQRFVRALVHNACTSGNLRHMLIVLCAQLKLIVQQFREREAQNKTTLKHKTGGELAHVSVPLGQTVLAMQCDLMTSEQHWLKSLISNIRLIMQAVLTFLPCHLREYFFRHLRKISYVKYSHHFGEGDGVADSSHCSIAMPQEPWATEDGSFPQHDTGEDCLRSMLSYLMQCFVHLPHESRTDPLRLAIISLFFTLLEAHDQDDCDHHANGSIASSQCVSPRHRTIPLTASKSHQTFLAPLMNVAADISFDNGRLKSSNIVPSKLAFRFVYSLLSLYSDRCEQAATMAPPRISLTKNNKSSSVIHFLSNSFRSSVSGLVASPIKKALRFFFPPAYSCPIADRSALLTLWLSYQFGVDGKQSDNPFRVALASLKDGMDRNGRVRTAAREIAVEKPTNRLFSFANLLNSIISTSSKEWSACFLFHLITINVSFRLYVIQHPLLSSLLLPLIHVLYERRNVEDNFVYMIANVFLVLSQEKSFLSFINNTVIDEPVPWIKEQRVERISMQHLLVTVFARCLHANAIRCSNKPHSPQPFGLSNFLATLSNVSVVLLHSSHQAASSASVIGSNLSSNAFTATESDTDAATLHMWSAHCLVECFGRNCENMRNILESFSTQSRYNFDNIEDLPKAFASFEATANVLIDILAHITLPQHLNRHRMLIAYLSHPALVTNFRRLHNVLQLEVSSQVRTFIKQVRVEELSPNERHHLLQAGEVEATDEVSCDLLLALLELLRPFEHLWENTNTATSSIMLGDTLELPYILPEAVSEKLPRAVFAYLGTIRSNLGDTDGYSGGILIPKHVYTPWPFDTLEVRGAYVHEERGSSCQYFWPLFRRFAYRLGVGKDAGGMPSVTPPYQFADNAGDHLSDAEVQRILSEFESGAHGINDDVMAENEEEDNLMAHQYENTRRQRHARQSSMQFA